jgi:hypothetical protein
MRANDRTLLASLGFSDPDKQDHRHDLACRYLSQPDVSSRLCGILLGPTLTSKNTVRNNADDEGVAAAVLGVRARTEMPISKGDGQYKTTIGFLDVSYEVGLSHHIYWGATIRNSLSAACEVKIGKTSVGEIIRQISLYREHRGVAAFAAVTAFPLTEGEVGQLRQANIYHLTLGPKFDQFCSADSAGNRPNASPEL